MLSFRNNCCKGCEDRKVGCHSTCETYITERDNYEELKAKIKAEKAKDSLYNSYRHQIFTKLGKGGQK